jgi:aminopeptidase
VFHNILFDENASSHIALGSAYPGCVKGGDSLDDEQFRALGGNVASVHRDLMIGSPDVSVEATLHDGRTIGLIENGEFAAG